MIKMLLIFVVIFCGTGCTKLSIKTGASFSSGNLNNVDNLASADLMFSYKSSAYSEFNVGIRHTSNVDANDSGTDGFFVEIRQSLLSFGGIR